MTLSELIAELERIGCVILAEDPPAMIACLTELWLSGKISTALKNALVAAIESFFIRSPSMACNTTHSTRSPGAGLCCAAVQGGQLIVPPAGTTLPVYTPGQDLTLPAGRRVQVIDAGGHCGQCMIVGSKSTKHPGRPVLKYVRGGPGCPTSGTGCCALSPQ